LVTDAEAILHFAEIGVVLMLFVIGLELDPQRLWKLRAFIACIAIAVDDSASVIPMSSATCQRNPSSMQNSPINAPHTTICSAPPPNTEARSFHKRCGSLRCRR
jgi:hypothetical protein